MRRIAATPMRSYDPLAAMTEKAWQAQVVQAARLCGWKVFHPWLSVHSAAGWPDLFMVKGSRAIAMELKREGKQPTVAQRAWLDALSLVSGIHSVVCRPSDFAAVMQLLQMETEV